MPGRGLLPDPSPGSGPDGGAERPVRRG
ncbi:rod shape-determining protein MreC, partial [Streptomyces sp. SID7982]|nr:rod shape-determining protein MreC [Streptomyces sp. SID7982]